MTQSVLVFLRRRGLLVLLTAVTVAAIAYAVASLRPVTYRAESVLSVSTGAGVTGPGQANEAVRLALTYSELIPRDKDVLVAVAAAVREPVTDVRTRLSVAPLGETSLLQLTYTSVDPTKALLGSRTAAESVVAGVATSDTVPRGSVRLVGLAEPSGLVVSGGVSRSTVPVGVVLGLGLGLVLAVAAERANRRIDDAGQVREVLDVPVLELEKASPARRSALVRLLRDAGPGERTTVVAVAGAGLAHAELVRACDRLAEGLPPSEVVVGGRLTAASDLGPGRPAGLDGSESSGSPAAPGARPAEPQVAHPVVLVPAGAPGSGQPDDDAVGLADAVVLVVPLAVRRSVVAGAVDNLLTYGSRPPGFVLLVRRGGWRGARSAAAAPRSPRPTPVGSSRIA